MNCASLDHAIRSFDLQALLEACQAGPRSADSALSATGYMRLINAGADAPGGELLRALHALDGLFGGPDPQDKGVLLLLLSKGDAACLDWARGHGLRMERVHLSNYIDYALTRLPLMRLDEEAGWACAPVAAHEFKTVLLAMAFLRGDGFEQLAHLHDHADAQLVGGAVSGRQLGREVAKILYRGQACDIGPEILYPSDGGCAWFLRHAKTKDLLDGAGDIMMDEANRKTLIKPLAKHLPRGAIEHEAKMIDAGTVPARAGSRKRRL